MVICEFLNRKPHKLEIRKIIAGGSTSDWHCRKIFPSGQPEGNKKK